MAVIICENNKNSILESGRALVKPGKKQSVGLLDEDDSSQRSNQFQVYRNAYERVPLVTAIVDVQADHAVQDFFFTGPRKKQLARWADKVNLSQFFHRIAKSMLIYGNGYVELIRKAGKIVELKLLDPVWIDVYRNPVGDVMGYSQIIGDKKLVLWGTTGDLAQDRSFEKNFLDISSIVHFRHNVLGSEKYGFSIIRPLLPSIKIKMSMEDSLQKVLNKYVAPLIWAKVGNDQFPANTTVVNEISDTLRDLQAESEITTSHLVDLNVLQFNAKGMDINTPLSHVEQQIITGGQVPPTLLGRESSGKADAEVQLRSFGRHIKSLQRELKNEFEDKIILQQGMGSENDSLVWVQAEERESERETDILRGLVTDGILTPQKANSLLPPDFQEKLPENVVQVARPNQMVDNKVGDNPNDPTQSTTNNNAKGRIVKSDREVPVK